MVIVDQEEIIQITADFLGRLHGGINIKIPPVREGRKHLRQSAGLDPRGNAQLCPYTLVRQSQGLTFPGRLCVMHGHRHDKQRRRRNRKPKHVRNTSQPVQSNGQPQPQSHAPRAYAEAMRNLQAKEKERKQCTQE